MSNGAGDGKGGRRWEGWSSCSALVAEAAAVTMPHARHVLDVGCGAGNYSLKLLESLPNLDVTLSQSGVQPR